MSLYSEKMRKAVVERAMAAVEARAAGAHSYTAGGQTFDLDAGGWCNRFIRQCFETTLGFKPKTWRYGAAKARDTLDKLDLANHTIIDAKPSTLQPGDIIGWYNGSGPYGHIALYVGDYYGDGRKLVAENTSAKRGYPNPPGTKVTQLRNMRPGWSAYRLFPAIEKAGRPNE
jgi:cell wall-associated NlpC family hydrolase